MSKDKAARIGAIAAAGIALLDSINQSDTNSKLFQIGQSIPSGGLPSFSGLGNLAMMTPNGAPGTASLRNILLPDLVSITGLARQFIATPSGAPGSVTIRNIVPIDVIGIQAPGAGTDGPMSTITAATTLQYFLVERYATTDYNVRKYVNRDGYFSYAINCVYDNVAGTWSRDAASTALLLEITNIGMTAQIRGPGEVSPWSNSQWQFKTDYRSGGMPRYTAGAFSMGQMHFTLSEANSVIGDVVYGSVSYGALYTGKTLGSPTLSNIILVNNGFDATTFATDQETSYGCRIRCTTEAAGPVQITGQLVLSGN